MVAAMDVTTRTATEAMIASDTMIVVVSVVIVRSEATTEAIVMVEAAAAPTATERSAAVAAADMTATMSVVAVAAAVTPVEKSDASVMMAATDESIVTPAVRSEVETGMGHEKTDVRLATSVNALTALSEMVPVLATLLPLAMAKPPPDLRLVRHTEVRRDWQTTTTRLV